MNTPMLAAGPSTVHANSSTWEWPRFGLMQVVETTLEEGSIIGFKGGQGDVEQGAFRDDDNIEPIRDLVATKHLSNQSFSSISVNRATELPGRRNPQPSHPKVVWKDEQSGVTAAGPDAPGVDLLVFDAAANAFVRAESHHQPAVSVEQQPSSREPGAEKLPYSLLTVSRLRPFARRRFSTSRPFFVLIRTRNPWVFLRWRLLGWNVRFPFMLPPGAPAPIKTNL